MSTTELKKTIIEEISSMEEEHDLAQIRAFVLSLKVGVLEGQSHWNSLSKETRQRMVEIAKSPDAKDGTWIPHDQVMAKYKQWFA